MQLQFDDDFACFGEFSVGVQVKTVSSELDEYLRLPLESVKDPLKWWFENRRLYPNLYRMAQDYLSVPGVRSLCR